MSRPNGAATARPASSSATSFERAGPPAAPLDAARRGVVARRTNRPHHHAGVGVGDFVRDHRVVARLHVHGDVGTASARRAHARYRVGEVDDADGHHDATVEGSGRVRPAVGPAGWHVRHEGIDGTDAVLGTRCSSSATRVAADGVEVSKCWCNQMFTTRDVDVPLTAGPHTIVLEYDEALGQAEVSLSWQ